MRKILFIIIALFFTNYTFGQVSNQVKSYFKNNILQLDPLEGVYSARFFLQNRGRGFPKDWTETEEIAIKKEKNGDLHIVGNDQMIFRRIGDTNAYDVFVKFPAATATCRLVLTNAVSFTYEYKLPRKQLQYDGENPNAIMYFGGEFIKSYPTVSMYENALKKAQEETLPSEWTGTGFALKNNYIVTNYHVIDGAKSISVLGINGNFTKGYSADVIATDKNIDLAILQVNGVTIPSANIPYSVKTTNAEVGEEVFVLGYPMTSTMGEEIKLTTGVVSSRSGFQGDVSLYQTTAPIQPGNSGGPLFDSKGNIIGIVSAKHRGAENVGYAIKASYLRNLLESSISSNILPLSNKIAGQNLSGKVKSVRNYVFYIICTSKDNSYDSSIISKTSKDIETNPSNDVEANNDIPTIEDLIISANQGDSRAQYNLACFYLNGNGVEQNYNEAVEWFTKAADQGYVKALHNLGVMYERGEGVKQDYSKAFDLYTKAANKGLANSQYNLGLLYEKGKGVKQDYNKALEWFQKAADQGDVETQTYLGKKYMEGIGVEKDNNKAFKWYQMAANQGGARAQAYLGFLYIGDTGFEKDYGKALEWCSKAANQGDSYGQLLLGYMYYQGLGVEPNYQLSAEWNIKAANQGEIMAQSVLGFMYMNGVGVEKDIKKAYEWYFKAAEQGDEGAKEAIKELEKLK